jgi:hypothetical protein
MSVAEHVGGSLAHAAKEKAAKAVTKAARSKEVIKRTCLDQFRWQDHDPGVSLGVVRSAW